MKTGADAQSPKASSASASNATDADAGADEPNDLREEMFELDPRKGPNKASSPSEESAGAVDPTDGFC